MIVPLSSSYGRTDVTGVDIKYHFQKVDKPRETDLTMPTFFKKVPFSVIMIIIHFVLSTTWRQQHT